MARRIYEFICPDGHVTDSYVDEKIREAVCSTCEGKATRIVSAVASSLDPLSGAFPDATMKWAKHRQQKIQQERKENGE